MMSCMQDNICSTSVYQMAITSCGHENVPRVGFAAPRHFEGSHPIRPGHATVCVLRRDKEKRTK